MSENEFVLGNVDNFYTLAGLSDEVGDGGQEFLIIDGDGRISSLDGGEMSAMMDSYEAAMNEPGSMGSDADADADVAMGMDGSEGGDAVVDMADMMPDMTMPDMQDAIDDDMSAFG